MGLQDHNKLNGMALNVSNLTSYKGFNNTHAYNVDAPPVVVGFCAATWLGTSSWVCESVFCVS